MESQPQNPEFRNNSENFHPYDIDFVSRKPIFGVCEMLRHNDMQQRLAEILLVKNVYMILSDK